MDETLKKLLQSELLSEETRAELSEQWETSVENFKQQVREQVSGEVRLELAEQWAEQRDQLIKAVDTFVSEALEKEVEELRGNIERFRDLEVEYAEKIVEEKQRLAKELAGELDDLVDKMDAFLEMRLTEEISEPKEDLDLAKQNEFGRKIFEAFADTYGRAYVDEASVQSKLAIAESKLKATERALARQEAEMQKVLRESKLEQILAPLSGKKREQMAIILKNVETERLEESYKYFIGRVLKEDTEDKSEGTRTLSESKSQTRVVTGESHTPITDTADSKTGYLSEMKRLAGITKSCIL